MAAAHSPLRECVGGETPERGRLLRWGLLSLLGEEDLNKVTGCGGGASGEAESLGEAGFNPGKTVPGSRGSCSKTKAEKLVLDKE